MILLNEMVQNQKKLSLINKLNFEKDLLLSLIFTESDGFLVHKLANQELR